MKILCILLVQERSTHNITSLDITNLDTLPPKHGEPMKVYTRCASTVPLSCAISVSTSQSGENALSFTNVTPVLSDYTYDSNLQIALRKDKHICTSHSLSLLLFSFVIFL